MPPLLGQPKCYLPPPGCLPFAEPNTYLPPHNGIVTNAQTRSYMTIEILGPPPLRLASPFGRPKYHLPPHNNTTKKKF